MNDFLIKHAEYKYLDEYKKFGWFIKFYGGKGGGGYFEPAKDNETKEETFKRFVKHCNYDIPSLIKNFQVKLHKDWYETNTTRV